MPTDAGDPSAARGWSALAAAASAAWLHAAQAVQAFALGVSKGPPLPAVVESDPSQNVRRSAAIASSATLGGAALGPLLAGLLVPYGPLSPRLPYLIEIAPGDGKRTSSPATTSSSTSAGRCP